MSASTPWRSAMRLTLGAAALAAGFHFLPGGSRLNHMDFLGNKAAVLQFCNPRNTQPLPGLAGRPPVAMAWTPIEPLRAGFDGRVGFVLTTISGKPVGPRDLLPRGNPAIQLVIVGPDGRNFRRSEVLPGSGAEDWSFAFAPKTAGIYKVTAVFTPRATEKELTATAELKVGS